VTRRRVLLATGALALGLALYVGFRVMRTLSFFEVRRIELVGGVFVTPAAVTMAMALPKGLSIFDSPRPFARRVRGMAGVLEAEVSRRLPGTLRVVIREAEAVALAQRNGQLALLDDSGRVLPFDPTSPAVDLPLADPDAAVAGVLALIRDTNPDLFRRIERASRLRQDVLVEVAGGRMLFRADATPEAVHDLSLVEELLSRRHQPWRELDARFASRVVVRGKSA
jgi:cell division septal protein FtsQ